MSFEHSQMTSSYLVTFPSVWLPDTPATKVMLLAHSQQQANEYIERLHEKYPHVEWAFYLAPTSPPYTKDIVDWLWINHFHMDLVIAHAQDAFTIALWISMNKPNKFVLASDNPVVNCLISCANHNLWTDSTSLFEHIINNNLDKKST